MLRPVAGLVLLWSALWVAGLDHTIRSADRPTCGLGKAVMLATEDSEDDDEPLGARNRGLYDLQAPRRAHEPAARSRIEEPLERPTPQLPQADERAHPREK